MAHNVTASAAPKRRKPWYSRLLVALRNQALTGEEHYREQRKRRRCGMASTVKVKEYAMKDNPAARHASSFRESGDDIDANLRDRHLGRAEALREAEQRLSTTPPAAKGK